MTKLQEGLETGSFEIRILPRNPGYHAGWRWARNSRTREIVGFCTNRVFIRWRRVSR